MRMDHRNDDDRLHRVNGTEIDGGKNRGSHAAGAGKYRRPAGYIRESMATRNQGWS